MSVWPTHALGDVTTIVGGGTPTRSNDTYYGGSIPWVTPKDMKSWEIRSAQINLTETGLTNSTSRLVDPNSILVVVRSGVLKHTLPVALNRIPVAINQDMKAIRCSSRVYPDFLARFIKASAPEILQWVRATTADNFPIESLKNLQVPLPAFAEQCRIAEVLDRAETLRAQRRQALAQLDALAESIFLDMFGDPVSNPKKWPRKSTGRIGHVVTGNTPSRANPLYYGDTIEWIKSDNLNTSQDHATQASEYLSTAGRAVARVAPAGSILVTCIAGSPDCIGNAAMIEREVAFNQQINALIPIEGCLDFWFSQLTVGKRLVQAASTSGMKGMVSKSRFERIELVVPPEPLQQAFAARRRAVAALKALHVRALADADALFASLQHRAFRGEL